MNNYLFQIQVGIPGFSDGKKKKLSEKSLHDMNLAQLQVVVNDLHTQIESEYFSS